MIKSDNKKRRKFSLEEKYEILKEHYNDNCSWRYLCKKYNLSTSVIYRWDVKFKFEQTEENDIQSINNNAEIDKLKLELLKKEIEIMRLKKGYLVKGVGVKKEYVSTLDANTK